MHVAIIPDGNRRWAKKIFLFKDFDRTEPYAVEIALTLPVILNEDLNVIR